MSNPLKALLAVLVALFLLGACGDDDTDGDVSSADVEDTAADEESPSAEEEEGSSSEGGATDSEFVKQAEARCTEAGKEADAAFAKYAEEHPELANAQSFSDLPQEAQDDIAELFTGVFDGLVGDLRSLEPESQGDEWTAVLDEFEGAIDDFAADPAAASDEDPFADVGAKMAEFGLQECGG